MQIEHTREFEKAVLEFTSTIEKPINEKDLEALIYTGPVPSFNNMVEHIRRRFS